MAVWPNATGATTITPQHENDRQNTSEPAGSLHYLLGQSELSLPLELAKLPIHRRIKYELMLRNRLRAAMAQA